jgi:CheY-like chemotaxis protein
MTPPKPIDEPFRVTCVDDELVFLGPGPIGFSMTPAAARLSFQSLAAALLASAATPAELVVLLVDDEPLVREAGAALLADAGYVVIEAAGAAQALLVLETGVAVHLLFTDIQMPGDLDGLGLAHAVSDRWPLIKLLISSAHAAPAAGALPTHGRFMAKPYAATEMLRHIDELLAA